MNYRLHRIFHCIHLITACWWSLSNAVTTYDILSNLRHDGIFTRAEERQAALAFMTRGTELRRNDQHPSTILPRRLDLHFNSFKTDFSLQLRRIDSILPNGITISNDNEVIIFNGAVYDAEAIIISKMATPFPEPAARTDAHANTLKTNILGNRTVLKSTLARFYVQREGIAGKLHVEGSFIWDDAIYRIRSSQHPSLVDGSQALEVEDDLVVTRESLDDGGEENIIHDFKQLSAEAKSYRCAHGDHEFEASADAGRALGMFGKKAKLAKKLKRSPVVRQIVPDILVRMDSKKSTPEKPKGPDAVLKRDTAGCSVERKALYIGVAADSSYVAQFKNNKDRVIANIIADFSLVSAIYEKTFNIELGILSVTVLDANEPYKSKSAPWNLPCDGTVGMTDRLSAFSAWRGSQTPDAGMFHLVTGCADEDKVGVSWVGRICQTNTITDKSQGKTVSGTSASALIRNQYAVIAHEFGHGFGAGHDCTAEDCRLCSGQDCECCPCGSGCDCKAQYIMTPSVGFLRLQNFSDCSKSDICGRMHMFAKCLKPPGSLPSKRLAVCGNGIVEDGEECDCGTPEECDGNLCCQSDCKLKKNAECSDGNHSCCKNCKIRKVEEQFTCNASNTKCQFSMVCDGKNKNCPAVEIAPDGAECEISGAQCASGVCTSRDMQCKAVGRRLGIVHACSSSGSSCSVICEDPRRRNNQRPGWFAYGQCVQFDQHFVDGTPCGNHGFCQQGTCSEASLWSKLFSFGSSGSTDDPSSWAQISLLVLMGLLGGLVALLMIQSLKSCYQHLQWHWRGYRQNSRIRRL